MSATQEALQALAAVRAHLLSPDARAPLQPADAMKVMLAFHRLTVAADDAKGMYVRGPL